VLNRTKTRHRRRGRETRALARLAARDREAVDDERADAERFWQAVRTLPEQQARCVVLHYVDDLDAAAIGRVLELDPATVRVHLHRARLRLADLLDLDEDQT
jgi:RNA polymerase sigma factor (sigma-70 family)